MLGLDVIAQATLEDAVTTALELLYDAHGSTRAVVDHLAAVVQRMAYDAYGKNLAGATASTLTQLLYSGEVFDPAIGMQYLRARYYSPVTGRFSRLDTFHGFLYEPLTLNKYLYVSSNPINFIDPLGTFGIVDKLMVVAYSAIMFVLIGSVHTAVTGALDAIGIATPASTLQREQRLPILLSMATNLSAAVRSGAMSDLEAMAQFANIVSQYHTDGHLDDEEGFVDDFSEILTGKMPGRWPAAWAGDSPYYVDWVFGQSGFHADFQELPGPRSSPNQVRHFAGYVGAGYYWGYAATTALATGIESYQMIGDELSAERRNWGNNADIYLAARAAQLGQSLQGLLGGLDLSSVANWIRVNVGCRGRDGVWWLPDEIFDIEWPAPRPM